MEAAFEAWRGLKELTRGRLITLAGVICICFDSPTYRLLRLQLSPGTVQFGLAIACWRGFVSVIFIALYMLAADGVAGSVEQVKALGPKNLILATALLSASNCCFTTALARTTAATVLVILAAGPLVTATICWFVLGKRLPSHTLAACSVAFFAVALCFGGSVSAADGLAGCVLAILAVVTISAYWTLSEYLGAGVSLMPCAALAGAATSVVTAIALGKDLKGARPADAADFAGVVLSQALNALAILLLTNGSQVTPPAEVSLMMLLETAVAPFLVFAVVGERPSVPTGVAGALIIVTLASHTLYDAKRGSGAEAGEHHARGGAGGFEALGGEDEEQDEGTELVSAPDEAAGGGANGHHHHRGWDSGGGGGARAAAGGGGGDAGSGKRPAAGGGGVVVALGNGRTSL